MITFELFTLFDTFMLQCLLRNYLETRLKRQINLKKI